MIYQKRVSWPLVLLFVALICTTAMAAVTTIASVRRGQALLDPRGKCASFPQVCERAQR